MNNNFFKIGFFVIIAGFIAYVMFQGESDEGKLYIDTLHEQIEGLNEKISVLEADNRKIVTELTLKTDSLVIERQITIDAINKRRSAIRYYEKRIKARDALAVHDLDSIFTDRFGSSPPEVDGDRGN